MLLLFLSLFSNHDLSNCYQGQPKPNNRPLTDLIHKSIRDIDTMLKDFQLEIQKEKSVLRNLDLEENVDVDHLKEDLRQFDYNNTPFWWNDTAGHKNPDETFLPTPHGYGASITYANNFWTKFKSLPSAFYESSFTYPYNFTPIFFPVNLVSLKSSLALTTSSPEKTSPSTTTGGRIIPSSFTEDSTVPSLMDDTIASSFTDYNYVPNLLEDTNDPSFTEDFTDPSITENFSDPAVTDDTFVPPFVVDTFVPSYTEDFTDPSVTDDTFVPPFVVNTFVSSNTEDFTDPSFTENFTDPSVTDDTFVPPVVVDTFVPSNTEDVTDPSITKNFTDPSVTDDTFVPLYVVDKFVPSYTVDFTDPFLTENITMPLVLVHPPKLPFLKKSTAKPIKFSKNLPWLRSTNMKVDRQRPGGTPVDKPIKGNRITRKPSRPLSRTLSKAQAWVNSRRWKTTPTPTSDFSSMMAKPTAKLLRTEHTMNPQTVYTEELILEDDMGMLYVSIPSSLYTTRPTVYTTAGHVLFSADQYTFHPQDATTANEAFHEEMNATDEGYVIVYILELCKLVVMKEPKDVQEVVKHAELIMNKLTSENKLEFAGEQIKAVSVYFSRMLTDAIFDSELLRTNAVMMNLLINDRHASLSHDMNALIDYADTLFDDSKGEALFDSLKEFEEFPNITKSAWSICYDLIDNFIEPWREIAKTDRGEVLFDTLNKYIADRFGPVGIGYRKLKGDLLRMRGKATPKLVFSRETKSSTLSLKRRINVKRRLQVNRTRNRNANENHRKQYMPILAPKLRSLLPITRRQKRFKVIPPRQQRNTADNERPTKQFYYRRKLSRPTYSPYHMLEFFPQIPMEIEKAKYLKQSIKNHRRTRRLKNKLIRRSPKTQEEK